MANTHAKLIEELGGATALASRLTKVTNVGIVYRARVQMWKTKRGVPVAFRAIIGTLAQADGVELPNGFLSPTN